MVFTHYYFFSLFNNVKVSIYTNGKQWKNNNSAFNEIFKIKELNDFGNFSAELKNPSRGKFLKLSFDLTDQMMLLVSEVEFKFCKYCSKYSFQTLFLFLSFILII